jgi:putative nucleotidyltransferase with HDIG domain
MLTFLATTYFLLLVRTEFHVDWYGLIIFTALAIFAESLSIDIYVKDSSVSTSAVPFIAGIYLFGPVGAVVIGTGIALSSGLKNRRPIHRMIFNISNQAIGGFLCSSMLLIAGDQFSIRQSEPLLFIFALIIGGILFLSTTALLSLAIGLDKGVNAREVWMRNYQWLGPIYLAMGALGYALVHNFQNLRMLGVIAIIAPLMVLRLSQHQYLHRTKVLVKALKSMNRDLAQSSVEIHALNAEFLEALAEVIDLGDPYVLGHSQNVAKTAKRLAQELGLSSGDADGIYRAGLLHDLGKVGIPEAILQKTGRLTDDEFEIVEKHLCIVAQVVEKYHSLKALVPIIRHCHEKFDGTGYPDGLKGTEIPIGSRILSVVDAVEEMSSGRPNQRSLEPARIMEEVRKMRGEYLDPHVIDVFLKVIKTEGDIIFHQSAVKVCEKINGDANRNDPLVPVSSDRFTFIGENG